MAENLKITILNNILSSHPRRGVTDLFYQHYLENIAYYNIYYKIRSAAVIDTSILLRIFQNEKYEKSV